MPWPIRRILANRWTQVARRRLFWADAITPETVETTCAKGTNRKTDPEFVKDVSSRLQSDLAARWPNIPVMARIRRFSDEIGWSNSRAKDVYYGDQRVSLRSFEQTEIELWFDQQKEARA